VELQRPSASRGSPRAPALRQPHIAHLCPGFSARPGRGVRGGKRRSWRARLRLECSQAPRERMRAGGAGLAGQSTADRVRAANRRRQGKTPIRYFDGRPYVLEAGHHQDFALIRAATADHFGNRWCPRRYRRTSTCSFEKAARVDDRSRRRISFHREIAAQRGRLARVCVTLWCRSPSRMDGAHLPSGPPSGLFLRLYWAQTLTRRDRGGAGGPAAGGRFGGEPRRGPAVQSRTHLGDRPVILHSRTGCSTTAAPTPAITSTPTFTTPAASS